MNPIYTSIVSHSDLDGVACAALCSSLFSIGRISFTAPSSVEEEEIDSGTIVCDLPYPRECGLWFDHHMSNTEALRLRKIDPASLPGKLSDEPSCFRVICKYFADIHDLSGWLPLAEEVDRVDGFLFESVEEWRKDSPGRTLDLAIKQDWSDPFLQYLTRLLMTGDLSSAVRDPDVITRGEAMRHSEHSQIELIRKVSKTLDLRQEIVLIDLTESHNPPVLQRNLAFAVYPGAKCVVEARCRYERGMKTNDIGLSASLGFFDSARRKRKNLGEIMRRLNIGDGHPGAAAGLLRCQSKNERQKTFREVLEQIGDLWREQ